MAVPSLVALGEVSEVVGVVCQPDRPSGRGMKLRAPPVKDKALELGLDVHQPVKVKTGNLDEWVAGRAADAAVVLAYGRILPPAVLAAPRLGCLNLHASLLPRYRGAAPINWALIRGETETGVSLMQMDEGLDTGPVYCMHRLAIAEQDDAGSLTERIAELCARVVREDLPRVLAGEVTPTPQDHERATLAPLLDKATGRLQWNETARALHNRVRGLAPRPGAWTTHRGRTLKILQTATGRDTGRDAPPGTVVVADRTGVGVATGAGTLWLERAQPEGKKPRTGRDLVNGRAIEAGEVLGA